MSVHGEDGRRKRRSAIFGVSSLLLVAMAVVVTVGIKSDWSASAADGSEKELSASKKAVQAICSPTDYKGTCEKSLSKSAPDASDPKALIKAAFDAAAKEITKISSESTLLKELQKDPSTKKAAEACKELLNDAVDDLHRSFNTIDSIDLNNVDRLLSNLKVWLSATITYQETCLDGFDDTTGDVSERMRHLLNTSMELSSNGMAIVDDMAKIANTLHSPSMVTSRHLLSSTDIAAHVVGHGGYGTDSTVFKRLLRKIIKNRRLLGSSADDRRTISHGAEDDEDSRDEVYELTFMSLVRHLLGVDSQVVGHDVDDDVLDAEHEPTITKRPLRDLLSVADEQVGGHDNEDDDQLIGFPAGWTNFMPEPTKRKLLQAALTTSPPPNPNVVVAKDGTGKYSRIQDALNEVPKYNNQTFVIYVKEGVYEEYVKVDKWLTHVLIIGDGPTKTRLTGNRNYVDGTPTFKTATLIVAGDHFIAKDIGVENTAGAIKHQAVALRVQSDQSIFYNCHMDGYQDTLYAHTYRQYYRDCRISGTIDFIFGDASAFFQNCTFVVRKPLDNQNCIVTAQGRKERHQPTGIILHNCTITGEADYIPLKDKNKAYLGRPWKQYSKTIIMESYIEGLIQPEGWLPWMGDFALDTCYYGEYNNDGPGAAGLTQRVKWRGFKTIVPSRAEKFMPMAFFSGDDWITASRVPYIPTLTTAPPPQLSALPPVIDEDPNAPAAAAPNELGDTNSSGTLSPSSPQSSSGSSSSSSYDSASSSASASDSTSSSDSNSNGSLPDSSQQEDQSSKPSSPSSLTDSARSSTSSLGSPTSTTKLASPASSPATSVSPSSASTITESDMIISPSRSSDNEDSPSIGLSPCSEDGKLVTDLERILMESTDEEAPEEDNIAITPDADTPSASAQVQPPNPAPTPSSSGNSIIALTPSTYAPGRSPTSSTDELLDWLPPGLSPISEADAVPPSKLGVEGPADRSGSAPLSDAQAIIRWMPICLAFALYIY